MLILTSLTAESRIWLSSMNEKNSEAKHSPYVYRRAPRGANKALFLGEGEFPRGAISAYPRILLEIQPEEREAATHYKEVDLTPANEFVRERFSTGGAPFISFEGNGGYGIVRNHLWLLYPPKPSDLKLVGPSFTEILGQAEQFRGFDDESNIMKLQVIETRLQDGLPAALKQAIEMDKAGELTLVDPQGAKMIHINNPTSPTGSSAPFDLIEEVVDHFSPKGYIVSFDEVFGDAISDKHSAIPLTAKYNGVIVIRSMSKIIGLPGERIGYAVMSPDLEERYRRIRGVFPMNAHQRLVTNKIFNPKDPYLLKSHLIGTRVEIRDIKEELMGKLKEAGVSYLPTDPQVPILTVDGGTDIFYENLVDNLSTDVLPGSSFSGTHSRMSNRYVRLTVPGEKRQIPLIVQRMLGAKLVGLRGPRIDDEGDLIDLENFDDSLE